MKLTIKQLTVGLFCVGLLSGCASIDKTAYSSETQKREKKVNLFAKLKKKPFRVAEPIFITAVAADKVSFFPFTPMLLPALPLAYAPIEPSCIDFEPLHSLQDDLTTYAKKFLGTRYRPGGRSKKGFDCTNFTSYLMENFGYKIPAGCSQANHGEQVAFEEVRKGDLLFFGYKSKKRGSYRVSHVAMVVSDEGEEIHFIHAANRGIVIDNLESASWKSYYKGRYLFAKRIIQSAKDETLAMKGNQFVVNK
jgi:hypothetical protein